MTENGGRLYSITKNEKRLVLKTQNFIADKGSVLHSGIYNREFSSLLASFAVSGIAFFMLAMEFGKKNVLYFTTLLFFVATFPLFRKYVFRERQLEALFDNEEKEVRISIYSFRRKILVSRSLSCVAGLKIDSRKDEAANRDGVEFVKRISAMHGTAIPGFGEDTTFYSLVLSFSDGKDVVVLADSKPDKLLSAYEKIKEFLKI